MLNQRKSCFCAFCKTPRKVYSQKHLNMAGVISLVMLGIVFTYAIFQQLDIRGLGYVGLLLLVGELFCQLRWRSSMICQNCGFDPIVYMRSPEQAGLKIKSYLEKRAENPAFLLRPPVVLTPERHKKSDLLSLKA